MNNQHLIDPQELIQKSFKKQVLERNLKILFNPKSKFSMKFLALDFLSHFINDELIKAKLLDLASLEKNPSLNEIYHKILDGSYESIKNKNKRTQEEARSFWTSKSES